MWTFLISKGPPLYAYDSLFFTEKERKTIQENLGDGPPPLLKEGNSFYLKAIVYMNEEIWSLWINQEIICPKTVHKMEKFRLEKVTPYDVTFSWMPPKSTRRKTFTLRPYQTYDLQEQKVVDRSKN